MNKNLIVTLDGKKPARIPIWYMRQAGRYLPEYLRLREEEPDFVKFCFNSDLAKKASMQPLKRFDLDAAILFADILLIPYALGQDLTFKKNIGPILTPLQAQPMDAQLKIGALEKLTPIYQTLKSIKPLLAPHQALIGFAGAPWTVACYMLAGRSDPQQQIAKEFLFRHPDFFEQLISILIDATSHYFIKQIEAGAEIVQLFDSWAGALPADQFKAFIIEPTRQIVRNVKAVYPQVKIIGFAKNAGILSADYAQKTGIDAMSVDSSLPLDWIADHLQPHVVIQGNLDPALAVVGGKAMFSQARNILEILGKNGRLIFGLGHGIVPQTPPEHIAELTSFVRDWENGHKHA